MDSYPPVSTVYVQNLEERVKISQLSETLRTVFSEFGTVVDIVAKKNLRAKGQAFIVFDESASATNAISELQGFELFNKPMRLSLAKARSDKSIKMKCSSEVYESYRRSRVAEKDKRLATEAAGNERQAKKSAGQAKDGKPSKLAKATGLKSTGPTASQVVPDEYLPPNKILFLQHIPEECDFNALSSIFSGFEGFREIRFVPGRRGIAFVEYENEHEAVAAKENTSGMRLGENSLKVTYQRQ